MFENGEQTGNASGDPAREGAATAGDSVLGAGAILSAGDDQATVVVEANEQATVIASPDANKTVITQSISGDATVVTGAGQYVADAAVEQFHPVVEFAVSTHFPYVLARQQIANHILFEITSYFKGRDTARAPVALALVLDKSGSMEGRPMEQLKIAVKYLVDKLTPADLLTIVTFGEESEIVMPLRRVVNVELIKEHVDRIRPRGTTNLWAGMTDAIRELTSSHSPHHLKRMLLLTDGEANEGITDYQSIITEVRARRLAGVSYSTLGMGVEYNEELMMAIAKNTGGNYHFIEHPDEIPKVFERELGSLFGTVGAEARLTLRVRKGARVARVYGFEHEARDGAAVIELPALEAGKMQAVLVEMMMEPHPPARFKKLDTELSYLPFGQTERVSQRASAVFEFTVDKDKVRAHENDDVRRALAMRDVVAQLARASEVARTDAQTATMIVSQAETQLLDAGRGEDATIIASVKSKLERGQKDAATKLLSDARFKLDQDKTQIQQR
jgi:Ca-activated chloride channel family protein